MIIELIGLPGSGKSYLAGSFRTIPQISVITPRGKIAIVWGALWGCVLYPHVALNVLSLYRRHYTPGAGRYLFINGVVYKLAKYFYARTSRHALCAEGMVHNLLSLWGREVTLDEAVADLSLVPLPHVVVVLHHTVTDPTKTRAYKTREKLMPGHAALWWGILAKNFDTLQIALRARNIPVVLVTRETGFSEIKKQFSGAI